MMGWDTLTIILFMVFGIYVLARIADYAEEKRTKRIYKEAFKEALRQRLQQMRLDELYGRDPNTTREKEK